MQVPWNLIVKSSAVWAIITAHFCFNWGYYTLLAWLPSFFELALHLNVQNSSFLTVIPYLAMTFMTPLVVTSHHTSSHSFALTLRSVQRQILWLRKECLSRLCVRSVRESLSLVQRFAWLPAHGSHLEQSLPPVQSKHIMCGHSLRFVSLAPGNVMLIVALLTTAFGLSAWARAGLYCNHQDISPRFASALLGISNTAGAIPGILGVWSAGFLFDRTGNWATSLFYPIVAAQLIGLIVYTLFANSDPQEWS